MINHSYFLDVKDASKPAKIYLNCMLARNMRFRYSINEAVLQAEWDAKNFFAAVKKGSPNHANNSNANAVIGKVNRFMHELNYGITIDKPLPTREKLRAQLDVLISRRPVEPKKPAQGFFEMWAKVASERGDGTELNNGKRFSESTINGYGRTKRVLEIYVKDRAADLDMGTFAKADYLALHNYLVMLPNYNKSSIGLHLSRLKTMLGATFERGWHTNLYFRDPSFKIPTERPTKIDLSMDVLDRMDSMQLDGLEAVTRDWFILESMLGIRIDNLRRLTKDNIVGDFIVNRATKNGRETKVPISRLVRNALARNNGDMPPEIEYYQFSIAIKKVAEKTGMLEEKVLISETRQGKPVVKMVERHKVVTSHTARRSMVTNMRRAGLDKDDRLKLIGMSEKTMEIYDKTTITEVAEKVKGNKFFE